MPQAAGPTEPDDAAARLEAEVARHIWLGLLMARAGHDGRAELAGRHEPLCRLALLAMARTGREHRAVRVRVPRAAPP